jgi:glycosyltransferase involved in cell wall biosynthesis
MKNADILIITHLPAFYKINLYNELSGRKKIFVIFIGNSSSGREMDFTASEILFPFMVLNNTHYEERNKLLSCFRLIRVLYSMRNKYLLVNGWDLPEFWISVFAPCKGRKGVCVESSVYESAVSGIKKITKQVFLSMVHFALPSGEPHTQLLKMLHFNKPMQKVGGVGIPLHIERPAERHISGAKRFLYVGRLVAEKDLLFLINGFKHFPQGTLSIVGSGPLEQTLKQAAGENIRFLGYVPNNQLAAIYRQHDVFILPSVSEPWGLVVEEALQNGLPVIVSDKVGCNKDIVENLKAGKIFESHSRDSLLKTMRSLSDIVVYNEFCENVRKINFAAYYRRQVDAYELKWLD